MGGSNQGLHKTWHLVASSSLRCFKPPYEARLRANRYIKQKPTNESKTQLLQSMSMLVII